MNPLQDIHVRARDGRLAIETHAEYFASPAFAERIQFGGDRGVADQVAMVLYMLQNIALDPHDLERGVSALGRGVVHLRFFGWSNPVTMLELEDADDLERIRSAVAENATGPLFEAAKRALKWRARQGKGERGRDAVLSRMRQAMAWPTGRDEASRAETERLVKALHAKADAMRDRRRERLAVLSRAAGPQRAGWTDFLNAMAVAVLAPESDQRH
jgi:hypothetical protein